MASLDNGKYEVVAWIKDNFPSGATCLDVGACDGKWANLLRDYLRMDAVEIYLPYIWEHNLVFKYKKVYVGDILDYVYSYYDLIIFGDVIEHMTIENAKSVLEYAYNRCKNMIIAVPFQYKQDAVRGNEWERHIQDDLTPELFEKRYPGFRILCRPSENYAYYIKKESDE